MFDSSRNTFEDIFTNANFNLKHVLVRISQLERDICAEVNMPDQELFFVVVSLGKSMISKKGEIRKLFTRQSLLFLDQDEQPCFSEKGHSSLESPEKLLLEDDGMGGVMKSMIASSLTKILLV